MIIFLVVVLALYFQHSFAQSYQPHNADTSILRGASKACLEVYNSNVSCSSEIGLLYSNPYQNFESDDLARLCTETCRSSLQTHRAAIEAQCKTARYVDSLDGTIYTPTALDEELIAAYDIACLKRSDGCYCNTWFQDQDKAKQRISECDECVLGMSQVDASSPFNQDEGIQDRHISLTSSCSATGYPVRKPSAAVITSHFPATKTCTGTYYTLQPTDTFESVPKQQGVSTEQLLNSNGLPFSAKAFPKTGKLCIENNCKTHVVKANETCRALAAQENLSVARIRAWNWNINPSCSNLEDLIGSTICLSNPLGDFAVKAAPKGTSAHASSNGGDKMKHTRPAFTPGPSTRIPWESDAPSVNDNYPVIPLAKGTRLDCYSYIWLNNTNLEEGSDCWIFGEVFGADREDFAAWNPSIDKNPPNAPSPTYDYSCTLSASVSYCVAAASPSPESPPKPRAPPEPRAKGEIESCTAWDTLDRGTACDIYLNSMDVSMEDFYMMNPSVKKDCSGLVAGTYYCIDSPKLDHEQGSQATSIASTIAAGTSGTSNHPRPTEIPTKTSPVSGTPLPTPIQSGVIKSCTKFHKVVSGNTCSSLAASAKIDLDDFYSWNPAVGKDCHALQKGFFVCVAATSNSSPKSSTNSPAPTSTKVPGVKAPGPTQTGVAANCNKYVLQKKGVYCDDMAKAAGISSEHLHEWNPDLGQDCKGLWKGYAYCIGVS